MLNYRNSNQCAEGKLPAQGEQSVCEAASLRVNISRPVELRILGHADYQVISVSLGETPTSMYVSGSEGSSAPIK
ncbi:hypothetical protein RRG08_018578 [Elysia crispata]|uniref:Uncharacterized protein n=1 Tax=Elysia crispata TaxID=231223 RepID=A0AAE1A724_9GAST|nr:hypothetical protein RRG08_018578 [Elysia crispata]